MLSIVVPVFNEEESLEVFYKELEPIAFGFKEYEIIFVDDGSSDSSLEILKQLASKSKKIRVFSFRRNQGKAEALTLGFQKAKGKFIVTMDADLQDLPDQVKIVISNLDKGYDLVSGWRKDRKDSFKHVIFSRIFNSIAGMLWKVNLHDYNCGLKAYSSDCAKSLRLYGGLHRFIPLLAYQQGFKVAEVPVVHQKRKYGKSKYGISKVWKDLPDMFTMYFLSKYGKRPMHFFGIIGFLLSIIGFATLVYLYIFVHSRGLSITARPLFFFGIIFLLAGFQIFFTGFLADLMINKSYEQNSPALKFSTE